MDQLFHSLCVGLYLPKVEQAALRMVMDVSSIFLIEIFAILHHHHSTKDCQSNWHQDMALLCSVENTKGSDSLLLSLT